MVGRVDERTEALTTSLLRGNKHHDVKEIAYKGLVRPNLFENRKAVKEEWEKV